MDPAEILVDSAMCSIAQCPDSRKDTLQLLLRASQGGGSDVTQVFRPFSVTVSNEATPVYSFVNWLNDDFITDFIRGTNVGDTSTATFHVDADHSIEMDVLLRSIETIEADSSIDTISAADLSGRWVGACTTTDSGSQKDTYVLARNHNVSI